MGVSWAGLHCFSLDAIAVQNPFQDPNQLREVLLNRLPNQTQVHVIVLVNDDVAHPNNLSPGEFGNGGMGFWRDAIGGFTNNFRCGD